MNQPNSLQNKKNIYVYRDHGVHPGSLKQTLQMLRDFLGNNYLIKTIDAETIKNKTWIENTALLVIPGGADSPYAAKLNGAGNATIKEFVASGGAYIGICAGSYYATSYIEFDKGGELEVLEPRELAFFPGKSAGPILAKYDYNSNSGALAANILDESGNNISLFYNGGGYFQNAEDYDNTKVLGWYQTKGCNLPAIIHVKYGAGNVLLSGVHFEYSYSYLQNRDDSYLKALLPALSTSETQRKLVIKSIFTALELY